MQKITPFLWFNDQVEEAAHFYTSVFQNSGIDSVNRMGDDVPGPKGKVMTVTFHLAGLAFMGLNGGPEYSFTPAISFFVSCETREEIDVLWAKLSEGGTALMELGPYPFSEKFGWLQDKYGVSWQLSLAGTQQKIAPYFLFVGKQHGRAEEAVRFYTSVFKNSSIRQIDHFGKDMGEPEGTVMHAEFVLDGQEFIAMDSALGHPFTFTPAISLFVSCEGQAEVDMFWEKLSHGGEKGPCGWLTDRFGVSWQVVPTVLMELMSDPDREKASRVTQAMLKMSKIDIGLLREAYAGG